MGAFSNLSGRVHLVQAITWKGNVPDNILHRRIYNRLGLGDMMDTKIKGLYPVLRTPLSEWSSDKINPGDFADINDSLGLALYGAEKGL
jgi:hypothetical protein